MGDLKSGLKAWRALKGGTTPPDLGAKAGATPTGSPSAPTGDSGRADLNAAKAQSDVAAAKECVPRETRLVEVRYGSVKERQPLAPAAVQKHKKQHKSPGARRPVLPKPLPPTRPMAVAHETKPEPPKRPAVVPREFKLHRRSSLRRQDYFKVPDPWVAAGAKTQMSGSAASRSLDIVIGLDFGTSYTKAAVGLLDKIFPVTWEGVSKSEPSFLLPSEYSLLSDGATYLGQHPGASVADLKADLKIPFINPAVSIRSIATASIFLALVLRYVRAWVYEFHGEKIRGASIRWQLNIGAPSNGLEVGHLELAYKRLGYTAWLLSENPAKLSAALAEEVARAWQINQLPASLIDLNVRPEFVAQLAGYVQSPQRNPGLHALVDVGGGTMDIVTFNVHTVNDEDTFPFFVPDVQPLGTQGLSQNRLAGVPDDENRVLPDELAPVPSPEIFSAETGIELGHVMRRDNIFRDEVGKVVRTVFETTKSRRYRLAPAWTTGVRTFFTGGGAQADLYRETILGVRIPSPKGLQLMQLPAHPKLDGFAGSIDDYQRISVACGLAQDAFSLGRIVPARFVEDDKPVTYEKRERPDRDELYPH